MFRPLIPLLACLVSGYNFAMNAGDDCYCSMDEPPREFLVDPEMAASASQAKAVCTPGEVGLARVAFQQSYVEQRGGISECSAFLPRASRSTRAIVVVVVVVVGVVVVVVGEQLCLGH